MIGRFSINTLNYKKKIQRFYLLLAFYSIIWYAYNVNLIFIELIVYVVMNKTPKCFKYTARELQTIFVIIFLMFKLFVQQFGFAM